MIIRQEAPSDYDEVDRLVEASFATAAHGDGTEAQYLRELREKASFIPELSLVAEDENGALTGQIVLSKTTLATPHGERTELLLSPLCVHPACFRRGIARALTEEALRIAGGLGFGAVFLCGDPQIYGRLGFAPSYRYHIFHKNDEAQAAEWSLVRELYAGALAGVSGAINTV
ncbi:MAG: N-acetyltransferase [Clostridiales bacterium]|nr:N-acetyltransferase [Clostridiales bacterium]